MELYGLIGEKLGHSYSPQIQERLFTLLKAEGCYMLFEIPQEKISFAGEAIRVLKVRGVNVTIPYKQDMLKQADDLSPEAKAIGAVNTLLLRNDGTLYGANTDYYGFGRMLNAAEIDVKDRTCTVLGSGGASKAVLSYLQDAGAREIYLISRDPQKPISLPQGVSVTRLSYESLVKVDGQVIINTTPVGMYPQCGITPVNEKIISKYDALVDLIYNPSETEFLRIGRLAGKKTCDGLYMLVAQAARSQEIWQGRPVNEEIIRKIYEEMKEAMA